MRHFRLKHNTTVTCGNNGSALLFTLMVIIVLTSLVGAYLGFVEASTKSTGYQIVDSQAIYLADAGLQKAIWNLMRTTANGGQGEDWITAGTTENLGEGSYTMVVERWDFALAANGSSASATSTNKDNVATNTIDGNSLTYWQSGDAPRGGQPQELIITFPYTLTVNKARFVVPADAAQQRPKAYSWQASADGITYTTLFSTSSNSEIDVTDEFSAQSNVNYFKIRTTAIGGGVEGVRIATLEVIGNKITATGTVDVINRELEQTLVVDDATQTAFGQIDWNEL